MRTLINNKLVEIHNIIADRKNNSHYGLLGGSLGEVLFLFYFGELIRKENVAVIATQRLEDTIKIINSSKNVLFSFGNGISGKICKYFCNCLIICNLNTSLLGRSLPIAA